MSLIFKDGRGRTVPAGASQVKGFDGSIHGYSMPRPSTPTAPPAQAPASQGAYDSWGNKMTGRGGAPRPEEARWQALLNKYNAYVQGRGPALSAAEMAEYQTLSQRLHSSEGGLYWETRNAQRDASSAISEQRREQLRANSPFQYVDIGGGKMRVPNPEWGRQNGFIWDGDKWRPRSSEDDIREQITQMEMEKRRWDLDRARQDYERQRMWDTEDRKRKQAEEDFKRQQEGWAYQELQRRIAEASQPATPQPSQDAMMDYRKRELADENERFAKQQAARQEAYRKSIGFNPGTQPAKNAYMPVVQPSAAQPVEPQSEGTPYGQQAAKPASAYGFQPPPAGHNLMRMDWWHNPSTGEETQATAGSIAPPGWVKGRLGEAAQPPAAPTPLGPVPGRQATPGPRGERWAF